MSTNNQSRNNQSRINQSRNNQERELLALIDKMKRGELKEGIKVMNTEMDKRTYTEMSRELEEAETIYCKDEATYIKEVNELEKLEATPITSDFDSMVQYFEDLHALNILLPRFRARKVRAHKEVQAIKAAEAEAAAVEAAEAAKLLATELGIIGSIGYEAGFSLVKAVMTM